MLMMQAPLASIGAYAWATGELLTCVAQASSQRVILRMTATGAEGPAHDCKVTSPRLESRSRGGARAAADACDGVAVSALRRACARGCSRGL